MRTRIRLLAPMLMIALAAIPLQSLDLIDGRVKLTLHEGIGRFSLSYLTNVKEGKYTPLLVAQDPRTSALSVVVGNKVYRMGESSEFTESLEKTETGARFAWKSSLLTITESFSFVASPGSTLSSGVRIDLVIKNISQQDLSIGARYLFDTYLGEESFIHFRTDSLPEANHETTLAGNAMPAYWVSPLTGDAGELGLQSMTSGPGITVPARVVFANWKRLSDASWSYESSSARNFSLLPYSVNDSAVCQYYDPHTLARGAEMTITLVLGKYSRSGLAASAEPAPAVTTPSKVEAPAQPPVVEKVAPNISIEIRGELESVNKMLSDIDAKIGAAAAVTDSELSALESAISDLKDRAAKYGTGK